MLRLRGSGEGKKRGRGSEEIPATMVFKPILNSSDCDLMRDSLQKDSINIKLWLESLDVDKLSSFAI